MNQLQRNYYGIISLTLLALFLLTVGIEYSQFQRHQKLILLDLKHHLDEHAANINLRTRTLRGYVDGLKKVSENSLFYIKTFHHTSFLFPLLKESQDKEYFYLEPDRLLAKQSEVGNLVGLGSIATLSKDRRDEINMALFLDTVFPTTLKNVQGALRAYYISTHHFQNLYPWSRTNPQTLADDPQTILQLAGPKQNPRRLPVWPPVNITEGKEHTLTTASPVYDGHTFLGLVGMDISLKELQREMDQFPSSSGHLFLINEQQQVLAAQPTQEAAQLKDLLPSNMIQKVLQKIKSPTQGFSLEGKSIIYTKTLHDAPWTLVYVDSKSKLFFDVFFDALKGIVIISIILIFIVGTGYYLVVRNFISPAQKLVNHIQNENQGISSPPKNLPEKWRAWFEIVSNIFAENRALMENLEHRVQERTRQLEQKNHELEKALTSLKKAKNQIIVQEKLASLGSLAAGIAHEIKNPLNFISNFTELSLEYLHELKGKISNEDKLFTLIEQNMQKSREHAERADRIVKAMLAHARGSTGEITTFNLNDLLSQSVDLAYFGFQGQEHHFAAKITKNFDSHIQNIEGYEQDLTRVFLNILNNSLFSMNEKLAEHKTNYHPELTISTRDKGETVEIIFQDNGKGMTATVLSKIFHPFFTTKGADKGTGLGLSLSHDIITRQHHGHLTAESKHGEFSRLIIELPKQ